MHARELSERESGQGPSAARRRSDERLGSGVPGGFTLIELLIVIVVIGILAAIAVPKLNVTKTRAYRNSMISDLKNLANSQEIYHLNNYTYSNSLSALAQTASQAVFVAVNEADQVGWAATATRPTPTS